MSGVLLGSLAVFVVLYCTFTVAGPGGEITPSNLVERICWLVYVVFSAPGAWVAERLFHDAPWTAFVLVWLECVVVSWLLIITCRLAVSKWRES